MKKGDLVEVVEFEAIKDPLTKEIKVKKFKRARKCTLILEGNVNTITKIMEYKDVSQKDLDMISLNNPKIPHNRYEIHYDNINEEEIS